MTNFPSAVTFTLWDARFIFVTFHFQKRGTRRVYCIRFMKAQEVSGHGSRWAEPRQNPSQTLTRLPTLHPFITYSSSVFTASAMPRIYWTCPLLGFEQLSSLLISRVNNAHMNRSSVGSRDARLHWGVYEKVKALHISNLRSVGIQNVATLNISLIDFHHM